jgi:hypothetical protein
VTTDGPAVARGPPGTSTPPRPAWGMLTAPVAASLTVSIRTGLHQSQTPDSPSLGLGGILPDSRTRQD